MFFFLHEHVDNTRTEVQKASRDVSHRYAH